MEVQKTNKICIEDSLNEPILAEDLNLETMIIGKHFLQMSKDERLYLMLLKSNINYKKLRFSEHSLRRMDDRFISENQVLSTIKNGQIIDYRLINSKPVLLIKSSFIKSASRQVVVALSLSGNVVVTVYCKYSDRNKFKKKHLKKYSNDLDILIPERYKKKIFFNYS